MPSTLRQVLQAFEGQSGPVSLAQMASWLEIERGTLQNMIDYWVRKGKLRASNGVADCTTCGQAKGCPFIMKMPMQYELARDDAPAPPPCEADGA